MELKGRVALVTGGATGIGRATVLAFARSGAAGVVVNYRSSMREAEEVAAQVQKMGVETLCVQADVRREEQVRNMIVQTQKRFRRLDILVNNAGVTRWVPLAELDSLTDQVWDEILDVNLIGAFRCIRAAAPLLSESAGVVVNVASISGILAPETMSSLAYGTAKAALIYMTRGLATALAPKIRVNAVAPAFTETKWMKDHFGDQYEEAVKRASERYPLKRVATPEDVAGAIVGLVRGGDFVTGQVLLVDGGLSLS